MNTFLFRVLMIFSVAFTAHAGEVIVAVAANFTAPMEKIAAAFEQDTGHKAVLSVGATGALYAQIANGAPFEVFLAADEKTPARLESEGLGQPGTRFTYAIGKLALWSKQPTLVDTKGDVLRNSKFQRIALADPKLAPYGAAAIETLTQLNLLEQLQPRFVIGENIAQAYQFVATENAALGFVALSQVYSDGKVTEGSVWIVPENLHAPLRQDAVILAKGKDNRAANALSAYLQSQKAINIMCSFGYTAGRAVAINPETRQAILLTVELASLTTLLLLLLATPLAWWLAYTRSRWRTALSAVVALPLVLPPTVLGFYLLVAFGPQGPLGQLTQALGLGLLSFTFGGLLIGSLIYSLPFAVQPLQHAFQTIGTRPMEVAATLRARPLDAFLTVALPMARPGFITAAILTFAHTVGEFGVVLMIGGNIPGRTRVISTQIYGHVEAMEYAQAHWLAGSMVLFSFVVLLGLGLLNRRNGRVPM